MTFSKDDRAALLDAAKERIVLPETVDTTAALAAHNLQFGLGRLLYATRVIRPAADVKFTASLDFTVTRSPARWGSGFSYGGLLELFPSDLGIVAPEIRPNTCGVLVGTINQHLTRDEIIERIVSVSSRFAPGAWDYSRRNHFLNVYQSRSTGRQVFLLHGCPEALRKDDSGRPGLYPEYSEYWRGRTRQISTPLGDVDLLLDEHADEYWDTYKHSETLSKADRLMTAEQIFGHYEVICNETHEGMASRSSYLLGCHLATNSADLYPLMTAVGKRAYLVSASISNGEQDTAHPLLPHGTGYEIPLTGHEFEVRCTPNGAILFVFEGDVDGTRVFRDFTNVPFAYRHESLVERWAAQGVLAIRDVLTPVVSTKV